jgi:2-dehydro-3-deoxyphosphogluconate aldolase/(4S)-4-hydroxy-2-oxoglutarate aldolase
MEKAEKLNLIEETGVIAIMRAQSSDHLIAAADAINKGGLRVIEVTMNTPDALKIIEDARSRYGEDVLFGAGTVLDAATAQRAISAGAGFIVAPTLNPAMLVVCKQHNLPVLPGCYTPTELITAWEAGADMIKLFPADVGGPGLLKSILAPLPQLKLVPVGGVNLDTTAEFIEYGAVAVGVGSSLINQKILDSGNLAELTRRAAAFIDQVKQGKKKRAN